jgi:hypothetical protein
MMKNNINAFVRGAASYRRPRRLLFCGTTFFEDILKSLSKYQCSRNFHHATACKRAVSPAKDHTWRNFMRKVTDTEREILVLLEHFNIEKL